MLDIGLKVYAVPFPPPHWPWGQGHRLLSHQSVIRKHSSFKYKKLGGSALYPKLLSTDPGYMPWDGAGGQNIEHPNTPVIFSFFLLLQVHFSFIGKVQFRQTTLFCDSSYSISWKKRQWWKFFKLCRHIDIDKMYLNNRKLRVTDQFCERVIALRNF